MTAGDRSVVDAVVIGGGVNGLVAADLLAEAGWDVLLLEGGELGGAVRSQRRGDAVVDLYSAFYPLAAASPALARLDLTRHGLRWARSRSVVAHPAGPDDDTGAVLHADPRDTAAALDRDHPGDGDVWLRLVAQWRQLREPLLRTLLGAWPPVGGPLRLAAVLGSAGALRLARLLAMPVTTMGEELFGGQAGRLLLLGNAMHADIPPVAAGSGAFGWLLCMLGQDVGFPVPVGGAGQLVQALQRRAESVGVQVEHGTVEAVDLVDGRAVGVRVAGGRQVRARRAVLGAVDAVVLLRDLVGVDRLPPSAADGLRGFRRDLPTLKVNWVLPRRVPWRAEAARAAATVHLGADVDGAVRWSADLESGALPEQPLLVAGQMAVADPTRVPDGGEHLWAYTHLPRSYARADPQALRAAGERLAERVGAVVEQFAPGALDGATDHFVQTPADLQDDDPALVAGALNGGTTQLHQQLVLRPFPGAWGPRLPVDGLYLAGMSAHPGGGVHGACGQNAAVAALRDASALGRLSGPARRRLRHLVLEGRAAPSS